MIPDNGNGPDGENGLLRWSRPVGGGKKPGPGTRQTILLVLALSVLGFIVGASALRMAAREKDNPRPEEYPPPARLDIRSDPIPVIPLRVDVDRVLVPVTVADLNNQIVTSLGKDDFEIFDNKVKQNILSFTIDDA